MSVDSKSFAERRGTSHAWTTLQMLEAMVEEIKSGKIEPIGAILVVAYETENKRTSFHTWRAGLSWEEEYAYLGIAKDDCLDYARGYKR